MLLFASQLKLLLGFFLELCFPPSADVVVFDASHSLLRLSGGLPQQLPLIFPASVLF